MLPASTMSQKKNAVPPQKKTHVTRLTLYILCKYSYQNETATEKKYANSRKKCKLNQQFAPPIFSSTKGFQTTDSTDLPLIPQTSHSVAGPLDNQYLCCYNTTFFCLGRFASNLSKPNPLSLSCFLWMSNGEVQTSFGMIWYVSI